MLHKSYSSTEAFENSYKKAYSSTNGKRVGYDIFLPRTSRGASIQKGNRARRHIDYILPPFILTDSTPFLTSSYKQLTELWQAIHTHYIDIRNCMECNRIYMYKIPVYNRGNFCTFREFQSLDFRISLSFLNLFKKALNYFKYP